MPLTFDFPRDEEFRKLIARRSELNLAVAALEIARDSQPDLDFEPTLRWIERRGQDLRGPVAKASSERRLLMELGACLSGMHGLHGTKEAFDDPESSYLNRVIATGVGIPISLSVVYLSVAEAAGVELVGVSTPMHFLCRYEAAEGPLFVDAFRSGQIMQYHECLSWLSMLNQMDESLIEPTLEAASPRDIIIRMLNNLKALHVRREDWRAAWKVQQRLTALQPGRYDQHRDLGLIALRASHFGEAIDLLEDCLRTCDESEQEVLQRHLRLARSRNSECN